ncbi:M28 family peptidase [Muricauda sp. SCSIO 64092]|uniref:M28 family peptidase n=1 Tax=Allomuricauda sp. SCSIO 64092 TaxID=2908842 RepID=UPI001FF27881|nr:M28 family peptidase [Muricauda sp. SCSIO 64092]UOY06798.1 M28 family peptidase [Muricauda sp. SCSIO 64092]
METVHLLNTLGQKQLRFLCEEIKNRCVGSKENLMATQYFERQLRANGWEIEKQSFDAFDWDSGPAHIISNEVNIEASSSPYSEACDVRAEFLTVSTLGELENLDGKGKILILKDELTLEPLMPKNFVFYNPESHQKIIRALENSRAAALIFVANSTSQYPNGEYPYPIIEDGDFKIPSVYISEKDAHNLLKDDPEQLRLISKTAKSPSQGHNIIGRKGNPRGKRITITAHIDAKKGSPGALDNATGVTSLLLLSELLKEYQKENMVELVALNGEDYYSVPGQMVFLEQKQGDFTDTMININIDGVGYHKGNTLLSVFNLAENHAKEVDSLFATYPDIVLGSPWYQGDHSMFIQNGIPAIALTSEWLLENIRTQRITHTERDTINMVDVTKLSELAIALQAFIYKL